MIKFLNCKIDLSKKVFEPRIETEYWVKRAIRELQIADCKLQILDIFAGSGCIGIAVLKNVKNSFVDFVDISKESIEQIKINLKLNGIKKGSYRLLRSNLFKKVKGKYDFIFANPPYVALERINEVQKEVLEKEPKIALFAGKDGLDLIRKFLPRAKKHLKKGGKIFMEFDPKQKVEIEKILKKENFNFQFKKDQFKKYRWLVAWRKNY
jgi:release factor glutamine methyltransferase